MRSGAADPAGNGASPKVNFLWVEVDGLHVALHDLAARECSHDFRHGGYLKPLVGTLAMHCDHFLAVEDAPRLGCRLRRSVCPVGWIVHVDVELDGVVSWLVLEVDAIPWFLLVPLLLLWLGVEFWKRCWLSPLFLLFDVEVAQRLQIVFVILPAQNL